MTSLFAECARDEDDPSCKQAQRIHTQFEATIQFSRKANSERKFSPYWVNLRRRVELPSRVRRYSPRHFVWLLQCFGNHNKNWGRSGLGRVGSGRVGPGRAGTEGMRLLSNTWQTRVPPKPPIISLFSSFHRAARDSRASASPLRRRAAAPRPSRFPLGTTLRSPIVSNKDTNFFLWPR